MRSSLLILLLCLTVLVSVAWLGVLPASSDCVDADTTRAAMAYLISHGLPGFDSWTPPATPTFTDVSTSYWAYKEIEFARAAGIVAGYPDGSYLPEASVDRAQMAVYLARAIAGGDANVPSFTGTPTFADVQISYWAIEYIEYLAAQIGAENIQSSSGIFAPTGKMTNNTAERWIQLGLGAAGDTCAIPGAVPIEPEHPEGWPEIVFTKQLAGTYQLYGVMADGAGLDRLYTWSASVACGGAVWAPDRTRIAYEIVDGSAPLGYEDQVCKLDFKTGIENTLGARPGRFPRSWSPDGSSLLGCTGLAFPAEAWIVAVDGSGGGTIYYGGLTMDWGARDARWLPEGARVAFVADFDAPGNLWGCHIWTADADGSGRARLTTGTGPFLSPRPSPDGALIGYEHTVSGHSQVFSMGPSGTGVTQLTSSAGSNYLAADAWSSDATKILFTSSRDGHLQVYVMDRDGAAQTNLSNNSADETAYGWSPDCTMVVLTSGDQVWVMNANGTGRHMVSEGTDPTWRAAGIRRVYLPRVTAEPDANLTLPLNVDTCLGVAGFQGRVDFDPNILECTGVVKGSLLPGSWAMPAPNIQNGLGYVNFIAYDAGAQGLPAGHGQMFRLSFHVKATAPAGATSDLHFTQCLVSDDMGDSILMTPVDGAVSMPSVDYQLSISGTNGYVWVNGESHSLPWSGSFAADSQVSIQAVQACTYQFIRWSGDIQTTENPTTVVMDSPKSITAEFSLVLCSVTFSGTHGAILVDGVPHALPWTGQVPCGNGVLLEAVPDPGYEFYLWFGHQWSSGSNPFWFNVSRYLEIEVLFRPVQARLSLYKTGRGSVAVNGNSNVPPWVASVDLGSEAWLEAFPESEQWTFSHWSGDLGGSVNPTSLLMNSDKSVTANFLLHALTLSISANPSTVWSGGQSQLSAQYSDSLAHSLSMYWRDMVAFDPYVLASLEGGTPWNIALRGDYAYCAAQGGLTVYDIATPGAPQRVGECDFPGDGRRLALSPGGDYAYVATQQHGVRIVNIADPAAPTDLGACSDLEQGYAVGVSGDYLYAWGSAFNEDRLAVYSLATPAAPVLLNEVGTDYNSWFGSMAMYGQYLFLAGSDLQVFGMYSPTELVYLNTLNDTYSRTIAVYGMYAYVGSSELQVLDLSYPWDPILVNSLSMYGGQIEDITISGNLAYVADYFNGLRVLDLSNPGAPVLVGFSTSPNTAYTVMVANGYAYVGGAKGFSVLDVVSPMEPMEIGADLTFGGTAETVTVGRYAYVAALGEGLRIFDLESPGGPSLVGSLAIPGQCIRHLAVSGQYVYAGVYGASLAIIDVSNVMSPQLIGSWQMYDPMNPCPPDVSVYGHYVFAAVPCCGGLHIIDVSDPTNPIERSVLEGGIAKCCGDPLSIYGTTLYSVSHDWGSPAYLSIYDISDPLQVTWVGTQFFPLPSDEYATTIATSGSSGILTAGSTAYILDLSDPANPETVASTTLNAWAIDSDISNGRAYVTTENGKATALNVIDIRDPSIPFIVGIYEGAGIWWPGPTVSAGEHVLFGDSGWGLTIFDLGNALDQPLGSFSPSQFVANPVYTAPENTGDQDLKIILECTATCDFDPRLKETATTTLTVTPCATLGAVSASGPPGGTARVPVMLELRSQQSDRFAFSAQVTALPGAPALAGALGFEAAAGLPAPGLVAPSGSNISVAWLSPLTQPVTGSVYLGDMLVPLATSVELGDAYSVCMLSVGASLGPDEICVEAGECAMLTSCGRLLAGDAYPVVGDHNSDADTCDFGEFGNDDITWGDVITVFDAWALPGSFPCGSGTWRHYALDSYPRDTEGAPGGDGNITWGDIITTFDRFANPTLPRPWRTVCDPVAPMIAPAPRDTMSVSRAAATAAPVLTVASGSGEPGSVVKLRVTLNLAGQQADRVAFAVEIAPVGEAGSAQLTSFEAAPGLLQPMIVSTTNGLAVAWMNPLPSALSGTATLGDLLVTLPSSATAGASWKVSLTAVGASLGEQELEPPVTAGNDATVTALAPAPHDVAVKLQAPAKVKTGETKRLVVEVENRTKTAETVVVRLLKGGQILQSWNIGLAGKERQRLQADCTFTEQDKPSVELKAEAVLAGDTKPQDNTANATVSVR